MAHVTFGWRIRILVAKIVCLFVGHQIDLGACSRCGRGSW